MLYKVPFASIAASARVCSRSLQVSEERCFLSVALARISECAFHGPRRGFFSLVPEALTRSFLILESGG